jgi:hypothetical protein
MTKLIAAFHKFCERAYKEFNNDYDGAAAAADDDDNNSNDNDSNYTENNS